MKEKIKKKRNKAPKQKDIVEVVNQIVDEVNRILRDKEKEKYFYGLTLLYSFTENLLRHMSFIDTIWKQSEEGEISDELIEEFRDYYFDKLNFYGIIEKVYDKKLIKKSLKVKLQELRKQRNDFIHQCWLYVQRNDGRYLRKELIGVVDIVNSLVERFNRMAEETGVLDLYHPSDLTKQEWIVKG